MVQTSAKCGYVISSTLKDMTKIIENKALEPDL